MTTEASRQAGAMDDSEPSERTALYRLYNTADELLYVGISSNFGHRWTAHAHVQPWWPEVQRQTVEWYPSRAEALTAETAAIETENPRYNGGLLARTDRPGEVEQAVRERLKELRQRSNRSQGDIAREMAERGWPWHQATVYKVESGSRPLRLGELGAC